MNRRFQNISKSWRQFARNKIGLLGIAIILSFIFMAVFANYLAAYNPLNVNSFFLAKPFLPPAWVRIFEPSIPKNSVYGLLGTDDLGSDVWSELVWGSRVSLIVGFVAGSISVIIGLLIGITSGYYGGKLDTVAMRGTDLILALPQLALLIVLVDVLNRSTWVIILLIGITAWATNARVVRSQVLTLKERAYVDASKVAGGSSSHIIFKHILPNVAPLVFANAAIMVSLAILAQAGLSFIGLGDPSIVSWGQMLYLAEQSGALTIPAWWYFVPPGVCITLVSLGFIFVGQALDEVINPALKTRIVR